MQSTRQAALISAGGADLSHREVDLYRHRRRGGHLKPYEHQWLNALWPDQILQMEEIAAGLDEQDEQVRDEIRRYPEGYGWHKGPGGGLPFDWHDSELATLRPSDWTVARHIRFVRTSRRATTPRRERRPGATRRTSSSSVTSSADPGDPLPAVALAGDLSRIAHRLRTNGRGIG